MVPSDVISKLPRLLHIKFTTILFKKYLMSRKESAQHVLDITTIGQQQQKVGKFMFMKIL